MAGSSIAGLQVQSTRNVITPDTKICALVYAPPKRGKTVFGGTLNDLTVKITGKPTLFIALEAGEGGGTMSIQHMDVPYVVPNSLNELEQLIAALTTDTTYGGIVLDSSTELVNRFLKAYALKFPSREGMATRVAGVPERSDYQIMGEKLRELLNRLINITALRDTKLRKHLMITATEKEKMDGQTLTAIQPDLPGAMAQSATAMFQIVGSIAVRELLEDNPAKPGQKIRTSRRTLLTESNGVRVVGDRTKILPGEAPLDWVEIWDKYWLPRLEQLKG